MKSVRSLSAILAFLILAPAAAAQLPPIDPQMLNLPPIAGEREALRQEILSTKARLARCDGPPNLALTSDNCRARTLVQAKLNHLLKMGMVLGTDQPVAEAPRVAPTDATDYVSERSFLLSKIRQEGQDIVHIVSEDRAKFTIIDHCKAMKDLSYLGSMMTSEETMALMGGAGAAKTKADVNACIHEYDAKEVSANRKAAIEYCLQANNYLTGNKGRAPFDTCMDRHDMMQAMCKQELELLQEYSIRSPGMQRGPQTCPGVQPNPREIQAILSAPGAGTMAELPAKFFAPPPDLSLPLSAPPVAIPAGTVLETTLQQGVSAVSVEHGDIPTARLDAPLAVGGQVILPAGTYILLKTRIIGPGTPPNSVQIGLTTTSAVLAGQKRMELKSDELVFTILRQPPSPFVRQPPALAGFSAAIQGFTTKLRFTLKP